MVSQRIPEGISPTAHRSNPFTSAPDCYPFRALPGYMCLVTQSCLTLCNTKDCNPPGSFVHGDSPGKNTRVGCHALQGIIPTHGSNPGLPHCRQFLYPQSHQGSLLPEQPLEKNLFTPKLLSDLDLGRIQTV